MKRGEIWWATLPEPVGSEPGYRRPVLLIQADEFNQSAIRTVVCAVITSNINVAGAPGNVQLSSRNSGLPRVSVVNVSQVLTVDRSLLTQRVKAIDMESMKQVDDGLRLVMKL